MAAVSDINNILENVKRIHMIGIGGSGMCPLAEILHGLGYVITGSDNNQSAPLQRVKNLGIQVYMGHSANNIGDAELIVYSAAISQDNPELAEAKNKGIPTIERSYLLGALTKRYKNCIGVCGTHGKTTVTSMITQVLVMENYDPTAVIGGKLPLIGANGRVGKSDYMVCEACEFVDTFLRLSPSIAVLLNIDNDHLDYFKTMDNMVASFHKFLSLAKDAVFVNGDNELSLKAAEGINAKIFKFGLGEGNDYVAQDIAVHNTGIEFKVRFFGKEQHIKLHIPGEHNIYNALAAFSVCHYLDAAPENIAKDLESFHGADRRFEVLANINDICLVDDYAHHPTEIKATLSAAKKLPYKRLVAVFQPFTFSRTAMLLDEFINALSIADEVVLTPIMGSREKNTYNISSYDIAKGLKNCTVIDTFDEVADYICGSVKPGDIVITMGGGDIYKAAYKIRDRMAKQLQPK